MGYINFFNFEGDRLVDSDQLNCMDYDDKLEMIGPGDEVTLSFAVKRNTAEAIQAKALPGIDVRFDDYQQEGELPIGEVAIPYHVIARNHEIRPDWLFCKAGFRLSSTTVSIKPDTRAGEEVFLIIQNERDEEKRRKE